MNPGNTRLMYQKAKELATKDTKSTIMSVVSKVVITAHTPRKLLPFFVVLEYQNFQL